MDWRFLMRFFFLSVDVGLSGWHSHYLLVTSDRDRFRYFVKSLPPKFFREFENFALIFRSNRARSVGSVNKRFSNVRR